MLGTELPVSMYTTKLQSIYTVETVMKIHHGEKEGDVLAFLTGQVTLARNKGEPDHMNV
jgi:HrpA-like RNA helicase